nr:PREDICTED: protein HIDE1 [Latimeria chalumnae]|eukprot:XP_014349445.1 PREDICTED: protein HIDE1 [Latimeria chalumnae]
MPSDPIQISVVRLPAPSILLDPPTGLVQMGRTLTINCSAPASFSSLMFFLYKGSEGDMGLQLSMPSNSSAIFTIPQVNSTSAGNYTCQYQNKILGRDLTSPFSDIIKVDIQEPHLSLVMVTYLVGLPVLLAVVLIAVMCFKKKIQKKKVKNEGEERGFREKRNSYFDVLKAPSEEASSDIYENIQDLKESQYQHPTSEPLYENVCVSL